MSDERDPLEELRGAWQGMEPRETGGDLSTADPRTRQVVAWLQAAWDTVEIPATPAPPARRGTPRLAWGRPLRIAAAAAVLVAALLAFDGWLLGPGGATPGPTDRRDDVPQTNEQAAAPRVVAATPERVEMRAGSVRLILVQATKQPDETGTNRPQ